MPEKVNFCRIILQIESWWILCFLFSFVPNLSKLKSPAYTSLNINYKKKKQKKKEGKRKGKYFLKVPFGITFQDAVQR